MLRSKGVKFEVPVADLLDSTNRAEALPISDQSDQSAHPCVNSDHKCSISEVWDKNQS